MRNLHACWVKQYGVPMTDDEQFDMIAAFGDYLGQVSGQCDCGDDAC